MTLIYIVYWLFLGANLQAVDILLFVYADVFIFAFWGFILCKENKEKKND